MNATQDLFARTYARFNARDIDGVLAHMHPDVDWPNAWEGGRVHGHQGIRQYWTRQWRELDPRVEPVGFYTDERGRVVVTVHQTVRDSNGVLIADTFVKHVYVLENGLIKRMDIETS